MARPKHSYTGALTICILSFDFFGFVFVQLAKITSFSTYDRAPLRIRRVWHMWRALKTPARTAGSSRLKHRCCEFTAQDSAGCCCDGAALWQSNKKKSEAFRTGAKKFVDGSLMSWEAVGSSRRWPFLRISERRVGGGGQPAKRLYSKPNILSQGSILTKSRTKLSTSWQNQESQFTWGSS